jgi:SPP1 family predicted phage head-tail adaptor
VTDALTIKPGQLNRPVTIRRQSGTADTFGQIADTWTDYRKCWAGVDLVRMEEAFGSNQLTSHKQVIWTARWSRLQILPGMRLISGSETYEIQAVNNVERRNRVTHMLCIILNAGS